ncbi:hypothetical protein [Kitasatospora sp. NPDC059571]|uniref:hypothetical protein n=1 Tax=Kitasatospora sp. NPDC059571 TaxID=3346871 RepID=UPI0036980F53
MEPRFYQGDAVVHADGTVYRCWANLRCWTDRVRARTFGGTSVHDGQQEWMGRLRFDTSADAGAVLVADNLRLVIGNGAQNAFLANAIDHATATLTIRGSGATPF